MSKKKPDFRIVFKSYYSRVADKVTKETAAVLKKTGARIRGPIPLPTRNKGGTYLKSPNGDKDARDQLKIPMHKRLIDVYDSTEKTSDLLRQPKELPSTLEMEIRTGVKTKEKG